MWILSAKSASILPRQNIPSTCFFCIFFSVIIICVVPVNILVHIYLWFFVSTKNWMPDLHGTRWYTFANGFDAMVTAACWAFAHGNSSHLEYLCVTIRVSTQLQNLVREQNQDIVVRRLTTNLAWRVILLLWLPCQTGSCNIAPYEAPSKLQWKPFDLFGSRTKLVFAGESTFKINILFIFVSVNFPRASSTFQGILELFNSLLECYLRLQLLMGDATIGQIWWSNTGYDVPRASSMHNAGASASKHLTKDGLPCFLSSMFRTCSYVLA